MFVWLIHNADTPCVQEMYIYWCVRIKTSYAKIGGIRGYIGTLRDYIGNLPDSICNSRKYIGNFYEYLGESHDYIGKLHEFAAGPWSPK